MKQQSERMAGNALRLLLQTLERNVKDTGIVLDSYEATHDDHELSRSGQYQALVAGHFALNDAIDKINDLLNK